MKFPNSLFRVLFNFLHIRFCVLKSIGNNTMKKMLLGYCSASSAYYELPTDVYCSNKLAKRKLGIDHHLFFKFMKLGEELSMQSKFAGAENVVKTETQQTFVNGLLGFITLGIYTPLEARVYCSQ